MAVGFSQLKVLVEEELLVPKVLTVRTVVVVEQLQEELAKQVSDLNGLKVFRISMQYVIQLSDLRGIVRGSRPRHPQATIIRTTYQSRRSPWTSSRSACLQRTSHPAVEHWPWLKCPMLMVQRLLRLESSVLRQYHHLPRRQTRL